MELTTVISLIFFGLLLIIVEIIFVPGTTLVGVGGFIFLTIGVWLSFKYFGSEMGWTTLGGTAVVSGLLLYFSFKANVWGKFALKSSMQGKVNEGDHFQTGQEGVAISALRPVGKAELGSRMVEVKTLGSYVDSGTKIRIIQVLSNQIIVEPIN
jgi:membrane-bound ClpP family serine protease